MVYQVTVVGGSNIDISATTNSSLVLGDSNPGKIQQSFGGVGRNIAENLARLNIKTRFITAYGNDAFAVLLKNQAAEIGMDVSLSLDCPEHSSSVYVCVNQPNGEIYTAVSDMNICDEISPEFLQQHLSVINDSDALVIDANLSADVLAFLAENVTIPIFADCVSSKKVRRLTAALPKLTGLKINRREAEALTGLSLERQEDARSMSRVLHGMGVGTILFTLGSDGAIISDGMATGFSPSLVRECINTTGCGDACLAGMIYAYLHGFDRDDILCSGMAMAALSASSQEAVDPALSVEKLTEIMAKSREVTQ